MSKAVRNNDREKLRRTASVHAVAEPSYLVQFQRGDGPVNVFCFMFVGGFRGEFATFAGLAPLIGREYSFYGVIARGTDGILESHRSVEEMAAAYIRQIRSVQPHGPYLILGECFSASVAYETAQQLRALGETVGLLAFLDARVPGTALNRIIGNHLAARLRYTMATIRDSSVVMRFQPLWEEIRTIRTTRGTMWPAHLLVRVGQAVARRASSRVAVETTPAPSHSPAPVMKAVPPDPKTRQLQRAGKNYRLAVRRYQRRPYAGKISIIASSEFYESGPTMGWKNVQELEKHRVPGTHDTYLRESRPLVVRLLRDLIATAEHPGH